MRDNNLYSELAARTDGAIMLGVVGPVRTGKSTFIKRFMEALVIPHIENDYLRERAIDELPQSASGKTIMTAEPKFVPENAVSIHVGDNTELSVRLVDCVGYMVDGAAGQFEDGRERMVTTPWFDHEVTITEAAEKGTWKVINEHSSIGVVVTTDGSIGEIPRENYESAEERTITELKEIGKPFIVLLNTTAPKSDFSIALSDGIAQKYSVRCIPVDCLHMSVSDINSILAYVLEEYPLKAVRIFLPDWLEALPENSDLRSKLLEAITQASSDLERIRDCPLFLRNLCEKEPIGAAELVKNDLGTGISEVMIQLPRDLYYQTISQQCGLAVENDRDLIALLTEMSMIRADYDQLRVALEDVRTKGYGVVIPDSSQMTLEEPQIVRQGGKYSVKLKANAPAIHMMMTNIETEVTPAIGGEGASEDIINFLLQGFDGDVNRIWQSNIFGKSLNDIAEEGLTAKIDSLPDKVKEKLRDTLERLINEGSGSLICILL